MKKALVEVSQGIGNIVQTTPTLKALKEMGYEIDLLYTSDGYGNGQTMELICDKSVVNQLFLDPSAPGYKYDAFISLFGPTHIKVLADCKTFYNVPAGSPYVTKYSEVLLNFAIAQELGYKKVPPSGYFKVSETALSDLPIKSETKKPYSDEVYDRMVVFFPGSKFNTFGVRKKYLKYGDVAEKVRPNHVLFVGTKSDYAFAKIAGYANHNWYVSDDPLISAYIASEARLVISNDSGYMHIRAITGKPQIAVFGPSGIAKNLPFNPEAVVIRSDNKCIPCQKNGKWQKCEGECMDFDANKITEKIDDLLYR